MSKKKPLKPTRKPAQTIKKSELNLTFPFVPGKTQTIIIYSLIVVSTLALALYYINYALSVNGSYGFPLDDPWIHLTFAKNLAEYQSFSYFKDQMATAGSTSPLYTILAAVGFIFTNNEMILSYALGIIFFILAAVSFYRLSSFEFGEENIFALICTAIFISDKWMSFIAVSGMETTMYIFFLIACAYYYKKRRAVPFAIFMGLILWGRPDGVAFIGAIIVDYLVVRYFAKTDTGLHLFDRNQLVKIAAIFGGIILLYFAMNFALSGSPLPNTYNAKLTYYSPEFRSRGDFFKFEVWDYFTAGVYALIMGGFLFSIFKMIGDFTKKKYNQNLLYIVFIFALVFIYWYKLPYAHRFGRYMMPIIPFFILVSSIGVKDLCRLIGGYAKSKQVANGLAFIILGIMLFMGVANYLENKETYAVENKYISDRQVAAAMWLLDNTPPEAVIGTHDVGAIGYYSGRRIVDVVGLVTPELINKLNDKDYVAYITEFMKKQGVTHLAFLREWNIVVNQEPLFTTLGKLPPEVMEIYEFKPDSTLIVSSRVKSMIMYAQEMLGQNAPQQAIQVLMQSLGEEPRSSYTYFLLGYAYSMLGDMQNFEQSMLKALEYYPDYKDVMINLGSVYINQQRFPDAQKYLDRVLQLDPDNPNANELYKSIPDSLKSK